MGVWYVYLGVTYALLGRYPKAVEAFRSAISLTPDYDLAHVCLAAVLVAEGKIDDARAAIEQAQSLGTRWTVRSTKTNTLMGPHLSEFLDGLRLAGLPE